MVLASNVFIHQALLMNEKVACQRKGCQNHQMKFDKICSGNSKSCDIFAIEM